jgi:hypothetical protein
LPRGDQHAAQLGGGILSAPRGRRILPGDRVRYRSEFCRQIGAATGWLPTARGVVVALWGGGQDLARIRWDYHPDGPGTEGGAHVSALERCS